MSETFPLDQEALPFSLAGYVEEDPDRGLILVTERDEGRVVMLLDVNNGQFVVSVAPPTEDEHSFSIFTDHANREEAFEHPQAVLDKIQRRDPVAYRYILLGEPIETTQDS